MFLRAAGAARHFCKSLETTMTDLNRRSALSLALAATAAAAAGSPATAQDQRTHASIPRRSTHCGSIRRSASPGSATPAETDAYVIGPEVIGGPPTLPDGSPARLVADFRTESGEIKRQAARFRVYAHLKDGSVVEVTAASAQIEWRVAIANLKAGWYEFNQAMDLPRGLAREARQRNRNAVSARRPRRARYRAEAAQHRRAQCRRGRVRRRRVLGQEGLSRRVADRRRRPAAVSRRARRVRAVQAGHEADDLRQQ